jgi:glycosyltransferase involved in cell wall biosynthesis
MPKVSVIIPTHNRPVLLKRAIESVLNQTYKDLECVVVDDASTESPEKICKELGVKYLQITPEESRGVSHARNLGIVSTVSDYVAFLDDDDYWLPEKIEKQVALMQSQTLDIVYCKVFYEFVGNDRAARIDWNSCSGYIGHGDLHKDILMNIATGSSCILVSRSLLMELGMFDEKLSLWSDYDLLVRAAQKCDFNLVDEALTVSRIDEFDPQRLNNKYSEWLNSLRYFRWKHSYVYSALKTKGKLRSMLLFQENAKNRARIQGLKLNHLIHAIKYRFLSRLIKIVESLEWSIHCIGVDYCPQLIIQKDWEKRYGHKIDWKNPKDLNEKIQWLICFGDTSRWPMLADKYRVRDYVIEKGHGHILTKLYGVWDNADKIDYDSLPDKFVLKCNHDSASTIFVNKTEGFDKEKINNALNKKLERRFGYLYCEPHYNKIKPLIIAEELLEEKGNSFSKSPVDYKVWCFDGTPFFISVCYNRDKTGLNNALFDCDWKPLSDICIYTNHVRESTIPIPRPHKLEEVLKIASDLSAGMPEARIDFYIIGDNVYFGEITLTSGSGRIDFLTDDFLKELGDKIVLPLKKDNTKAFEI